MWRRIAEVRHEPSNGVISPPLKVRRGTARSVTGSLWLTVRGGIRHRPAASPYNRGSLLNRDLTDLGPERQPGIDGRNGAMVA